MSWWLCECVCIYATLKSEFLQVCAYVSKWEIWGLLFLRYFSSPHQPPWTNWILRYCLTGHIFLILACPLLYDNMPYIVMSLLSIQILLPSFKEYWLLFCQTKKVLDCFDPLEVCCKASLGHVYCSICFVDCASPAPKIWPFHCLYWTPQVFN